MSWSIEVKKNQTNVLTHWYKTEKISQTCKPIDAGITQYAPSEEWDCKMFTRHHSLCTEGSYFFLPGEINYFHQQLVSLVKQKRNWNDNPLDNGLFSPLVLVIVIASAFTGKRCKFNNVCLFVHIGAVCVCVSKRLCVPFMSSSEWFLSESAFYSRISPGWVWLFDRMASQSPH